MSDVRENAIAAACEVLDFLADGWVVRIVGVLAREPHRYSALWRAVDGIPKTTLSKIVRRLERDGLVVRTVFSTMPPQVEYALTPLGRTVVEPMIALTEWAERNGARIQKCRERFERPPLCWPRAA